jgi:pyruvate dehydrogenase (quinone)
MNRALFLRADGSPSLSKLRCAMAQAVANLLLYPLHEWGVKRIFRHPGDGTNGMAGVLGRAPRKIDYVQARHEVLWAFMAGAHATFTASAPICAAR